MTTDAFSDMEESMNNTYATAPTAANTSNQLAGAASGLERLLNLAVSGYVAVTGAKNANTAQKQTLAQANATAPTPAGVASPGTVFGLPTSQVLLYGGLALAALVAVKMLRR
jgi:hypothetical protein